MKSVCVDVYEGDHCYSKSIFYPEEVLENTVGGMIYEYYIPLRGTRLTAEEARQYLTT